MASVSVALETLDGETATKQISGSGDDDALTSQDHLDLEEEHEEQDNDLLDILTVSLDNVWLRDQEH
jgi:hypothetical protein